VHTVRQLLPYWGHPALCLLLFTAPHGGSELHQLFPVLAEHGGVPHGSAVYKKVVRCLRKKSRQHPLYMRTFEEMHGENNINFIAMKIECALE
jgi:hypothetical protein